MNSHRKLRWKICLVGATLLFLPACSSTQRPASVHVAPLAVAPWEDYCESVQPTFKLSSEEALAQSIPNTAALEEKVLNALSADLKIAGPTISFSNTKTTHKETGQTATTKEDSTQTAASGDASKLTSGEPPGGNRTAAGLPSAASSVLSTPLGIDPLIKYWAATALYQEVQLLNQYVNDAAVADNWLAYVVRLQVSLMPWQRKQGCDAYTLISFFQGPFGTTDNLANPTNALGIRVIPLLVTDNLESMVQSRSAEQVRQMALALSAAIHGVSATAGLESLNDRLQTILGRDFNSTFTVARLCNNTLQCRFGASYAQGDYQMIPQTHNVTLLLLVPKQNQQGSTQLSEAERTVRLVASTMFCDAKSGKKIKQYDTAWLHPVVASKQASALFYPSSLLYYPSPEMITRSVKNVFRAYGYSGTNLPSVSEVVLLTRIARSNDFYAFKTNVIGICTRLRKGPATNQALELTADLAEFLWTDFVSVRNEARHATADLTVPQSLPWRWDTNVCSGAQPTVLDDGKSAASVTLTGERLNTLELDARLVVLIQKTNSGGAWQPTWSVLPAESIKVRARGRQAVFTFPSLAAHNLVPDQVKLTVNRLGPRNGCTTNEPTLDCSYVLATAKPGFGMVSGAKYVGADTNNTGTVTITFISAKPPVPTIHFSVEGANVVGYTAPSCSLTQDGNGWTLVPPSANAANTAVTVSLHLKDLSPFAPVTVSATDKSNKAQASPLVLPVLYRWQQDPSVFRK